jgi:hypothetical protein
MWKSSYRIFPGHFVDNVLTLFNKNKITFFQGNPSIYQPSNLDMQHQQ